MQLNKAFNAHVQIKVEGITKNFQNIDHSPLDNLIEVQGNPSDFILERVTGMREYKELVNDILNATGTRSQMMVNYMKDVFNMQAGVSAVRNGNILQHLQAEQSMLNLVFAFDHLIMLGIIYFSMYF